MIRSTAPFGLEALWLGAVYSAIGEQERYIAFYRGPIAQIRDGLQLGRGCVVVALVAALRNEEALSVATGLVEAAEATQNP